ncbi:MAG: nucleoside triphosphate pyrophosphohydrolase [Hyphomicrobiaceae bacterium]
MSDGTSAPTRKSIADLVAVMAALRTPVTGCPWDLEQTFQTIAPYTIEEAYEVADAIARGDMVDLAEELGDLLLQVVYHARIAEEAGVFTLEHVADGITRKMIRRHPHVFGDEATRSAGAAKGFWERIKAEEKAERRDARQRQGLAEPPDAAGVLAGVPPTMPALTRAVKLQDKAARVGFDWPDLTPVLAKLREELSELEAARASGDQAHVEEELGDLLFVVANVARHLAVDPEAGLRRANDKFTRRFRRIEEKLAALGRTPADSNLEEMDRFWNEAKAEEKAAPTAPRTRDPPV